MEFVNLFIHPVKFFQVIREKDKNFLLFPILVIIGIGVITGIHAGTALSSLELPENQVAMAKGVAIAAGIISTVLALGITMSLKALIFHFILKKMKGVGTLKSAFFITGISFMPKIFQALINLFYPGSIDVAMVGQFDWISFLAGIFSIFNLWQLLLMIIGFSAVYRVSYVKAAIPVVGFEIIFAWISLGIGLFTAGSLSALQQQVPELK